MVGVTVDDQQLRERIELGFTRPHQGHDGLPGAPEGVLCVRCVAERALATLLDRVAALTEERDARTLERDGLRVSVAALETALRDIEQRATSGQHASLLAREALSPGAEHNQQGGQPG